MYFCSKQTVQFTVLCTTCWAHFGSVKIRAGAVFFWGVVKTPQDYLLIVLCT